MRMRPTKLNRLTPVFVGGDLSRFFLVSPSLFSLDAHLEPETRDVQLTEDDDYTIPEAPPKESCRPSALPNQKFKMI